MEDIDQLRDLLKEHRKYCFHKSKCEFCKVPIEDDTYQCDNCGGVYSNIVYTDEIKCLCGKQTAVVCEAHGCDATTSCMEFIHLPDEYGLWFVYRDVCCPITKGAK